MEGDVHQPGGRARRGYGRWVRDVLVWTPGPLCLRNAIVAVDRVGGRHSATGKVRRLGEHPQIVTLYAAGATMESLWPNRNSVPRPLRSRRLSNADGLKRSGQSQNSVSCSASAMACW
jgi:hypothetical protein